MFKTFIDTIQKALQGRAPVNPAVFNDPVAETTQWGPAKHGGANFRTHKMVRTGKHRIEFKPTLGARLFGAVFSLAGIGMLIGSIALFAKGDKEAIGGVIMLGLMGLVFFGIGYGLYRSMTTPAVLDASLGLFWKGRRDPSLPSNRSTLKICVELGEIHAIQLLSERCSGGRNSRSYYSYELNFVLHSGERVNVIDHGNLNRIRDESDILSTLLEVPVWDAT